MMYIQRYASTRAVLMGIQQALPRGYYLLGGPTEQSILEYTAYTDVGGETLAVRRVLIVADLETWTTPMATTLCVDLNAVGETRVRHEAAACVEELRKGGASVPVDDGLADQVAILTKTHFAPGDVIICRGDFDHRAIRDFRESLFAAMPHLKGKTPIAFLPSNSDDDLYALPEDDARKLYAHLHARFGGKH